MFVIAYSYESRDPDDFERVYGPNGEWVEPRVLEVQFQGVKPNDVEQFRQPNVEVILWPDHLKSGKIIYPYTEAKH